MLENAKIPKEKRREIEYYLLHAVVSGFEPDVGRIARKYGVGVSTVRSMFKAVKASGPPSVTSAPAPAKIEDKIGEIGHFYEAGQSVEALALEFGFLEEEIRAALEAVGAESPEEQIARITAIEHLRRDEEEAWSLQEKRERGKARAEAIAHETAKLPPGQRVTEAAPSIVAPFESSGPVVARGGSMTIEAAPLGARYPIYEYLAAIQAEGKTFEVAELKRLLQDLANQNDLPNAKFKVMRGEMSGFWELIFGLHQQQRVFLHPVTVVVGGRLEDRVWVVLNGFTKKTTETPPSEMTRAKKAFAEFTASLQKGGRALKNPKKNAEDAFKTSPEERLLMSRLKLVEEFQLAMRDYMWRKKITEAWLAEKLAITVEVVKDLLGSPDTTFEELLDAAAALGLQLHGSIGPSLYK